jgi:hypothetical protein
MFQVLLYSTGMRYKFTGILVYSSSRVDSKSCTKGCCRDQIITKSSIIFCAQDQPRHISWSGSHIFIHITMSFVVRKLRKHNYDSRMRPNPGNERQNDVFDESVDFSQEDQQTTENQPVEQRPDVNAEDDEEAIRHLRTMILNDMREADLIDELFNDHDEFVTQQTEYIKKFDIKQDSFKYPLIYVLVRLHSVQ